MKQMKQIKDMKTVVIVGDSGVGKTSLVSTLRGNVIPKTHVETIGADMFPIYFCGYSR